MLMKIGINLDNDAFQGGPGTEIKRIFANIGDTVEEMITNKNNIKSFRDLNGNTVGYISLEED